VTNFLTDPAIRAFVANYRDITDHQKSHEALLAAEPPGPNANGNVSLAQLIRPLRLLVDGADVQWAQGRGRSSLRIGPTRAHLGDLHLALQGLRWQSGAEDPSNTTASSAAGSAAPLDGQRLSLKAQLESVEVAPWMQRAQPGFGWGGDLRINGRVDAQISPERVDLDLLLQRERGDLQITDPDNPRNPQRLGLADLRLGLSAHDGRWRLTQTLSGGNLGRLDGEQNLVAPPQALRPPPQSPVSGQIDLKVAQLGNWGRWLPAGWRLSGQLASSARLAGTVGAPEFSGELRGSNLAVRNLLQGVDWRDAEVNLQLEGARARIETLRIRAGEGTVSATGQIELGAAPRADLKLHADHFAALQRVDRRIVASGDAELQLDERSTTLKGSLRADEGRIDFSQSDSPSLSDDVSVKRPEDAAQARERAAAARNPRSTSIDVRADLGPSFTVKGRGLQSRLAGELRFSNPGNKLAVSGLIRAVDGNFASYGQKLRIDRGLLSFNGPVDNPRLDIEATRSDIEDVRVGVTVTGTAQAPRVRLFSVPTMTDTDRLSWLLLGRAPDGLGRTDLALLQRSAYSLLAGESDAPSLIERVGLDQLSVRQNDVGDTRETIVSLGKQLSRRWYVGYERGLNAAAGTWQLIYRAAERFTLRAQSGTENALDLIWTWKWGQGDELLTPITGPRPVAAPAPGAAASSARP
ncbi:MAG: translocation/assembly module TamB domain-containing protein, partial [Leptothrix sp. (in: b-proteobacteria)]